MENNICKCGHRREAHLSNDYQTEGACFDESRTIRICYWHTFKLDNLKYLEDLYDKRTK
jgi:hypothetical protein